jgi:hypothetical protein
VTGITCRCQLCSCSHGPTLSAKNADKGGAPGTRLETVESVGHDTKLFPVVRVYRDGNHMSVSTLFVLTRTHPVRKERGQGWGTPIPSSMPLPPRMSRPMGALQSHPDVVTLGIEIWTGPKLAADDVAGWRDGNLLDDLDAEAFEACDFARVIS